MKSAENFSPTLCSWPIQSMFWSRAPIFSLREISRVLASGGIALVQLPNIFGLRSLMNRAKRALRPRAPPEVNYYTPSELKRIFSETVGPTTLSVDGYFSLNPRATDMDMLPRRFQAVVRSSMMLQRLSERVPPMLSLADSIYVIARRPA